MPTKSTERRIFSPPWHIEAHITGNVWKIEVAVGDEVEDGDTVVILESMKMEIPVEAEDDGDVKEIRCEEGQAVSEGDVLVVLDERACEEQLAGGKLLLDFPAEAVARHPHLQPRAAQRPRPRDPRRPCRGAAAPRSTGSRPAAC